ncbi:uncharacterized protein LOC107274867 [Cephus cinctus]|uniref:Uncharacterized protein LOC107274867 n=1 Tax=Cephus cinctus TaxID=211228 RepID=A0AAJ7FV68_CEPCN|nr:uncharacterized protein LOC107274867 [Cephus cinctus]
MHYVSRLLVFLGSFWTFRYCETTKNSEIAMILHRPIRALSFPNNSNMGIFLALVFPLAGSLKSVSLSYFFEANYYLPPNSTYFEPYYYPHASRKKRSIDRTTIYQALENKFESSGFPGRECLLRSICETAESPVRHNGILGDIMHVLFTPSSSMKEDDLSEDFFEAEFVGRNGSCSKYHPMCPLGLFDMIGTWA